MVVEPAVTAVTKPVELTVATEVLDEVHGEEAFAVPDPVNVMVLSVQTAAEPVIVGAAGSVKVMVLTCLHELLSVTVIV